MSLKNIYIIFMIIFLSSCGQIFNDSDKDENNSTVSSNVYSGRFAVITQDKEALVKYAKSNNATIVDVDADEGIYEIVDISSSFTADRIQRELLGKVEHVEPAYKINANSLPRDPMFMQQWALVNLGQNLLSGGIEGNHGSDIGALKAWELNKGSKEVVVAVIDTGIDYNHQDLKDNMWINQAEKNGFEGIDDDGNGYIDDVYGYRFVNSEVKAPLGGVIGSSDPMDDNSHGTHCAGIIGAVGNNGVGVVGVNWNVRLMALKFLNFKGSGSTIDAYRSIKYAIKNKADILSNSWGGGDESIILKKIIQDAHDAGILFVAAAGNSTSNNDIEPSFPANYKIDSLISVAALANNDKLAYFSSYGEKSVHIAAPGYSILSTVPGNKYQAYSGTSMATPFVSGAAALLLAHDPSFKGQPSKIKERLMSTTDYLPGLNSSVASPGRLNVYNALTNKVDARVVRASNEQWIIKDVNIKTPYSPTNIIRYTKEIHEPGAAKIKLYIDSSIVDSYDSGFVTNKNFQRVHTFNNDQGGIWTPEIDGDTAYVFFNNSKLQDFIIGFEIVDSEVIFNEAADGEPFINFNSEGVVITKVAVLAK